MTSPPGRSKMTGLDELCGDEQWEVSFRKPPLHPPFLSSSPTDRWDGRSLFTVTSSKTVFGRERGRMEVGSEGRIQDVVLCFGSCSHAFSLLVPRCRCTSSPPTDINTHTPSPAPCFFDHISLFLLSVAAHRGFQQEVLISFLLLHVRGLKYTPVRHVHGQLRSPVAQHFFSSERTMRPEPSMSAGPDRMQWLLLVPPEHKCQQFNGHKNLWQCFIRIYSPQFFFCLLFFCTEEFP